MLKRWAYAGGSGLREIKIEVVWVVAWQEPDSSAIVSLQEILLNHFKKLRRVSLHVDVQNNAGIPSESLERSPQAVTNKGNVEFDFTFRISTP